MDSLGTYIKIPIYPIFSLLRGGLYTVCAQMLLFTHVALRLLVSRYYDKSKDGNHTLTWGFPKIRGTQRTIVFWGLYWGPLILGKYHINHGLLNLDSCSQGRV